MSFDQPVYLWGLLLIPILGGLFIWNSRWKARVMARFVPARLLERLQAGVSPRRQQIKFGLFLLGLSSLVLALARPIWGFEVESGNQKGLDIIVAIDVSKSMLAEDLAPDRLTRAKLAALDLVEQTRGDRMGVVAFAGTAFLQCPPCVDKEAFRQSVQILDTTIIPQGGSAISDAINAALEAFEKEETGNARILVIFSDGEDHDSEVISTARKAAKKNLRIFTVGVGTPEGEHIRVRDARGVVSLVKDLEGKVVRTRLNEKLLQEVALEGQGFYLPLRGAKTMETLYHNGLVKVPKVQFATRKVLQQHHRFQWPLAFGLLLLLAETLFPTRKPNPRGEVVERAAVRLQKGAVLLLVLLGGQLSLSASPQSALKNYEEGKFGESLEEYRNLIRKNPDDPRLHFNAGAAAFKEKQFDLSERAFNSSLVTDDLKLQQKAYYNLGNTFFHQGEEMEDGEDRMEKWEGAIRQYDLALKLEPQDRDALFNRELVKKRLELLKKQMAQSQGQGKKKSKNQSKSKKGKGSDQGDSEGSDPENKENEKEEGEKPGLPEPVSKEEEKQRGGNQGEEKDKGKGKKEDEKASQPGKESPMNPKEAMHILDVQRADEKALIFAPPTRTNRTQRAFKDW